MSKDVISIVVASFSFLISIYTFYITQIRRPKLAVVVGPKVTAYYQAEGQFCIYVPLSFLNSSYQTGPVHHVALTITEPGSEGKTYYMEWAAFARYSPENNRWLLDEVAHAVAVPGRSSIHQLAWFTWRDSDLPPLILEEGEYKLGIHIWTGTKPKLTITSEHSLYVHHKTATDLQNHREKTVNIMLDEASGENRLLDEHKLRRLLR